jgi:hypothetical protein
LEAVCVGEAAITDANGTALRTRTGRQRRTCRGRAVPHSNAAGVAFPFLGVFTIFLLLIVPPRPRPRPKSFQGHPIESTSTPRAQAEGGTHQASPPGKHKIHPWLPCYPRQRDLASLYKPPAVPAFLLVVPNLLGHCSRAEFDPRVYWLLECL